MPATSSGTLTVHTVKADKCLKEAFDEVRAELREFHVANSNITDINWQIELQARDGVVKMNFYPVSPYLRGGGGEYEYRCDSEELLLIKGYR